MKSSSRTVVVLLVLTSLGIGACARPVFEQHLRAGRWSDAAAAFAVDSARHDDPSSLRRAAHLHATPDSATFDPERAVELLTAARAHSRRGRLPASDTRLQRVLLQVVRDRRAHAQEEQLLRTRLSIAESEAHEARLERSRLAGAVAVREEERAALAARITVLEETVRERETQIAALRLELERLKAIDLTPPARASPSVAPRTSPR